MCILFMCVPNNGNKQESAGIRMSRFPSYKLILASNRDEKLSRPTAPASFWEGSEDSHILGGRDLEELGTWLGISKHGKLGVLLNIMHAASSDGEQNAESVSRGSLVTGFLRSPPGFPGWTYLKNLCHLDIVRNYKPFHLITVDFGDVEAVEMALNHSKNFGNEDGSIITPAHSSIRVGYLTNQSGNGRGTLENISPPANTCGFHGFGNSGIDRPLRKVEYGKIEFENIVKRHCEDANCTEDSLVDELLQFLKSSERHFPDETLEQEAKGAKIPTEILPYFSARYVHVPGIDYGTRTHTIILVDAMNKVSFHEWTMNDPSKTTDESNWSHSKFTFTLYP